MATLDRAIAIAAEGHAGQKDRGGKSYILHSLRVMMKMDTEEEMIAAILHDVKEDTDLTTKMLIEEGFKTFTVHAIECLTHQDEDSYSEYIERVKTSEMATKVKIADLEDNLDIKRLKNRRNLKEKDMQRIQKYLNAWTYLTGI